MTPAQATEVIAKVGELYNGRVLPDAIEEWALAVLMLRYSDVLEGARRMAKECEHPSLASLLRFTRDARGDRESHEAALAARRRKALPPPSAIAEAEREARVKLARERAQEVLRDIQRRTAVVNRPSRRARTGALAERVSVAVAQTPEEADARRAEIQRQAEQLQREDEAAMRDAFASEPNEEKR